MVLLAIIGAIAVLQALSILNRARKYRRTVLPERYNLQTVRIDQIDLPRDAENFLKYIRHCLPGWFEKAAVWCEQTRSLDVFWEAAAERKYALTTVRLVDRPGKPTQVSCGIQFFSNFPSGTGLVTLNTIPEDATEPTQRLIVIPNSLNASELLQVYDAALRHFFPDVQSVPFAPLDYADWLQAGFSQWRERMINGGYIDGSQAKYTWKGAVKTTIDGTNVVVMARLIAAKIRARAMLRTLGLPLEYARGNRVPCDWFTGDPQDLACDQQDHSLDLYCPRCKYNLNGSSSNVCSECGLSYNRQALASALAQGVQPAARLHAVARVTAQSLLILAVGLAPAVLTKLSIIRSNQLVEVAFTWLAVCLWMVVKHASGSCRYAATRILAYDQIVQADGTGSTSVRSVRQMARSLLLNQLLIVAIILAAFFCLFWNAR